MAKTVKKRSRKVGASPGTLMHIGTQKPGSTNLEVFEYSSRDLQRRAITALNECPTCKPAPTVTWINVDGISNVELLQHIGSCFTIHPLVLEDVLATDQRPKALEYDRHLYVVLKMLTLEQTSFQIQTEQVSFVLGERYLLSFQEGLAGDVFEPVRVRLLNDKGRLRNMGPDYLLYALLDVIVDNYFLILEGLAERIEDLEEAVVSDPAPGILQDINRLRREMLFLHKAVWPLRETVGSLQRRDSLLITDGTVLYFRDLYDHTVQVVDTLETQREILSGLLEIYLSSSSNRLNAVMKVLTIIATIFMPLSFITSWYGMNFAFMPELKLRYGYPAVLLLMLAIAVAMLVLFRKKRWL